MAVMRQQLSGFGFPLMHLGNLLGALRFITNDTAQLVKDSIHQILMTIPGERVDLPDFGCRARAMLFEGSSATTKETMQTLIYEALVKWETRITVKASDIVVTETYTAVNSYAIQISYTLKNAGTSDSSQSTTVLY